MEGKYAFYLGIFIIVLFVSGCIQEDPVPTPDPGTACQSPKKMISGVCCFDENSNNVCDMEEAGCPTTCDDGNECTNDTCSADTGFECVHDVIADCCGNGICERLEDINNICPADCRIIDMSEFYYEGTPDFIEDEKFVFIHTTATEEAFRLFIVNITAEDELYENIRYTYYCNSTIKNSDLDSIKTVPENLTEEITPVINKFDNANYLVYSYFFTPGRSPAYHLNIDELELGDEAQFHLKINKKEPEKRDTLECLVKLYFMKPRKNIYRIVKVSFI